MVLQDQDSQALATLAMAALSFALAFDLGCGIGERPVIAGQVRDYGERNRIGTLAFAAVVDAMYSRLHHRGACGVDGDLRSFAPAVTADIHDAAGIDHDSDSSVTAS